MLGLPHRMNEFIYAPTRLQVVITFMWEVFRVCQLQEFSLVFLTSPDPSISSGHQVLAAEKTIPAQ